MQKTIELMSNGLGIVTVSMCALVVIFWSKSAIQIIKSGRKFQTEDWFITGVFFGFLGEVLDNFYWTIAWTMHYLNHHGADFVMQNGFYANIPFRQLLGIFAAYCHIRSAIQYSSSKDKKANSLLIYCIFLGILYSLILINF